MGARPSGGVRAGGYGSRWNFVLHDEQVTPAKAARGALDIFASDAGVGSGRQGDQVLATRADHDEGRTGRLRWIRDHAARIDTIG